MIRKNEEENILTEYQNLISQEEEDNEKIKLIEEQRNNALIIIKLMDDDYTNSSISNDPFDLLKLFLMKKNMQIISEITIYLESLLHSISYEIKYPLLESEKNALLSKQRIVQEIKNNIVDISLEKCNHFSEFIHHIEIDEFMEHIKEFIQKRNANILLIQEITELQQLEMEIDMRKNKKEKLKKQIEKRKIKNRFTQS